jgi:hypothetical protein
MKLHITVAAAGPDHSADTNEASGPRSDLARRTAGYWYFGGQLNK